MLIPWSSVFLASDSTITCFVLWHPHDHMFASVVPPWQYLWWGGPRITWFFWWPHDPLFCVLSLGAPLVYTFFCDGAWWSIWTSRDRADFFQFLKIDGNRDFVNWIVKQTRFARNRDLFRNGFVALKKLSGNGGWQRLVRLFLTFNKMSGGECHQACKDTGLFQGLLFDLQSTCLIEFLFDKKRFRSKSHFRGFRPLDNV